MLQAADKEVYWSEKALQDKAFWSAHNPKIVKRIEDLICNIKETPHAGIGKPEQLKHKLSGLWSRRIDSEHRLIYAVQENSIEIKSCKGHYKR